MAAENWIGVLTVIINLAIGAAAIIANILISNKTIQANQALNIENAKVSTENAGKNRVIYETEQMDISRGNETLKQKLNSMLNTGNYTILSAFVDLGNTSQTRFILGKIKP